MLLPTVREELEPPPGEAASCTRYWYFAHQVGLWVESFCANVCDESRQIAVSRAVFRQRFMDGTPLWNSWNSAGSPLFTSCAGRSQAVLGLNRKAASGCCRLTRERRA